MQSLHVLIAGQPLVHQYIVITCKHCKGVVFCMDEVMETCGQFHSKLKHVSIEEFFNLSPLKVMSICSISHPQYLTLRGSISQCIAPSPITVLSLHHDSSLCHLSTRIPHLDHLLLGGLSVGNVTEICGPPGSGKTQFCLTMSVYCSAPSNGRGLKVLYIDTEGTFSAHRLLEIIQCNYSSDVVELIAEKVIVCTELTCNELEKKISSLEDSITDDIGLICVDSIASLLRKEFDTRTIKGLTDRNTFLCNCITRLKSLAQKYKITVVVTNQIVVTIPSNVHSTEPDSEQGVVSAALGNTWYHSVNTRLMLEMDNVSMGTRTLWIIKSPVSPVVSMTIKIDSKGFVQQDDN